MPPGVAGRAGAAAGARGAAESLGTMPSPLSFLTSGFSISLLILTIFINRIHALVPPRRPTTARVPSLTRIGLRAPSLVALALALACLVTHGRPGEASHRGFIWAWVTKPREDRDLLFLVFLAVSLAVLTETFIRALHDQLHTTQGFNLLSFSFLLHIHSVPYPSVPLAATSPARTWERNQLYSHLVLVLAELLTLHTSFAFSPPLPSLRLPITFLFSTLGQVFIAKGVRIVWLAALDGPSGSSSSGVAWDGTIWLSRAPEMVFEVISLMSIVLKFLSVVLRREPVRFASPPLRPLSQLTLPPPSQLSFESVFGHPSFYPHLDDDYAVAIIKSVLPHIPHIPLFPPAQLTLPPHRYGTSTLESTRLTGLSNEVDPILRASLASISPLLASPTTPEGPHVVLSRGKFACLHAGAGQSGSKDPGGGLGNEIRQVEAREREPPVDPMARHPDRFWELVRCGKIVGKWGVWGAWRAWRLVGRVTGRKRGDHEVLREDWRAWGPGEKEDAEDSDFDPESDDGGSSSSSSGESGDSDADEGDGEDDELAPTSLYQDLSHPPPYSSPHASTSLVPFDAPSPTPTTNDDDDDDDVLTPILLAHHLRPPSASPLTRRRYRALARGDQDDFLSAVVQRRKEVEWRALGGEHDHDGDGGARGRACVVCLGEERCVILWPCREFFLLFPLLPCDSGGGWTDEIGGETGCLSICEDCRANLADRTPASGHLCPTCRTPYVSRSCLPHPDLLVSYFGCYAGSRASRASYAPPPSLPPEPDRSGVLTLALSLLRQFIP